MATITTFLVSLWRLTADALRFAPELHQRVVAEPQARGLLLTLAILAGMALLLGQSIVLFINRVPPGWFAVGVFLNGLLFALRIVLWGAATWLLAWWLFGLEETMTVTIRLVALGCAPFLFGWLILIPYLGPVIARFLYVWSFLIVLQGLRQALPLGFGAALVCVGVGWALSLLVINLLERPFAALRDRFHRQRTGTPWLTNPEDILVAFAAQVADQDAAARRER